LHYNDLTWRHFRHPAAVGELSGPTVRRGAAGSRVQGTWVQFDVDIDSAKNGVIAARFLAFGCPHVIAVSDWVAREAAGRTASRALPATVQSLRERFGVPVEKLGRLLVIEDAWRAAISPPYPK
jgi:NifU-like protein involved in Fe-S cluster formation